MAEFEAQANQIWQPSNNASAIAVSDFDRIVIPPNHPVPTVTQEEVEQEMNMDIGSIPAYDDVGVLRGTFQITFHSHKCNCRASISHIIPEVTVIRLDSVVDPQIAVLTIFTLVLREMAIRVLVVGMQMATELVGRNVTATAANPAAFMTTTESLHLRIGKQRNSANVLARIKETIKASET